MAGIFLKGETKVRPGVYYNVTRSDEDSAAGEVNGVVAVLFQADFGPLMKLTELDEADGYEAAFGTALGTDAMKYALKGGAKKLLAVRVGTGGSESSLEIKDKDNTETVAEIKANYVGARDFRMLIREKLSDDSQYECIIYSGTKEFERLVFEKGEDEVQALVDAFTGSAFFNAVKKTDDRTKSLPVNEQLSFETGTNPNVSNEAYTEALGLIESEVFNVVCLDQDQYDSGAQLLLAGFLDRIEENGQFRMGVAAEKLEVPLQDRMQHAAELNNYKMHYVLNANVTESMEVIDGYQTAALMAGYIAAVPCSRSLTHTVLESVGQINEVLTPSNITKAELSGCIVLSYSAAKNVWIDSAINTMITTDENHDAGWKKIRRTKTRFELMTRLNQTAEELVGAVDNDANGRTTIISKLNTVGNDMVVEGKLLSCVVAEDLGRVAEGDSMWINVSVIDKDSAEKIYLTFAFQFSTNQ